MTSNTFYTLAVFAIVLLIITKPIGLWLTPIAQGRAPAVVDAIDRRLISVLAPSGREESWQRYAVSLLTFNTLGLIFYMSCSVFKVGCRLIRRASKESPPIRHSTLP